MVNALTILSNSKKMPGAKEGGERRCLYSLTLQFPLPISGCTLENPDGMRRIFSETCKALLPPCNPL